MDRICRTLRMFSLFVPALIIALGVGLKSVHAETYEYTIEAGNYEIADAGNGFQEIKMEGFGWLLDPGKPKLPSKIFSISIPPGAAIESVEATGVGLMDLEGTYRIAPAPMVSALSATDREIEQTKAEYERIVQEAYASDAPYPTREGEFRQKGAYRKYNLAMVRFSPFYYEAKSGKLYLYSSLNVTIHYSYSSDVSAEFEGLLEDNIPEAEERAAEFILNYQDAQRWYPAPPAPADDTPANTGGFVIVTTDALEEAVWPIRNWETCKGRVVHVETVEDIDATYSGVDRAERIRNFLRTYLSSWGILKVMLIGDITDVPMRYTYPNGPDGPDDDTTPWQLDDRVPTDYYYAELSLADNISWNSNGDAMYGQRGADNVQFPNEVDVGRIPWSDPTTVENICMKMVDFEYSTDMSYKLNYLFAAAFFWGDTDNAVVKTYIINNALDTVTYGYPVRIYEQGPCWDSLYWSDYALSRTITREVWGSSTEGPFGYVNLAGHGSHYGVYYKERHPTCSPEVFFYSPSDCAYLDDSHPSIVFSNACSTAWPEDNNLGRRLLERGAVSFVGSTRTAYGAYGWDEPSDGNCSTMDWLFSYWAARTNSSRSSVGWSHQQALRDMYNLYNWDTSWWQFFEWNIYSNPDLWLRDRPTNLPNLDYFYRTGWTYPIVPRSAAGATTTWCPVTTTLPGNTSNTYFNWTVENNGSYDAPVSKTYYYVDERFIGYRPVVIAAGASDYIINWDYGPTITGGRHSLYYEIDSDEEVWETSESDNWWGHQFVWSPYALADDTPLYHSTAPPHHTAWASPYWYNNDGFSFLVQAVHPNKWWSAVGILPYNAAADYDLRLWDIGDYTGSEQGFGGDYLEWSGSGAGSSDFVIVNDNTSAAGTYYAGVINSNDQTGSYHIEEATSTKIYAGTNGPYSMSSSAVLDIYEYYMYPAGDYGIRLEQTAGTCNLGMSLYDDETTHCRKSEYMTGGYANSSGDGGNEFMQVTVPDEGFHGLVVWNAGSGDYTKTATYRIKVGPCDTPGTPDNPSPADGATDVSVTSDLDWDDCADTEYYEVRLQEGSGLYVNLGTTETSQWALPTLNEGTTYTWIIKAVNICGTYVWGAYWSFTTEDKTAPTPNPMTWASEPYEISTSAISMVATTASDPSPPITYNFQFTDSPTGGTGGTSSGYIADTTYTDSGLQTNHQYGYRVYARDGALNLTSPSTPISYDYTDIETPTGVTFGNRTSTSIEARSTNTPSGLTRGSSGLNIYNDTAGTNSGWKQNNDFWNSTGLTPNTQYGFRAIARNGDANNTAWSSSSYPYTLANAPGTAAFSDITQTSIRANWTANGNRAGTQYYCENTTAGTGSGWTTATNWNSTGLSCGQSYMFRVRARNAEGTATDWVSLGSQSTLPCDTPPVIDAIDFEGCISELCTAAISVTAHDPAGGTLTNSYNPLNGGAIEGSGADVVFNPPDSGPHPCPYRVEVTVTSSVSGLSDTEVVDITVHLAGDANGSGRVDILDKRMVRDAYGSTPGSANWDPLADVNCSGRVDILDKRVVRDQFGDSGCSCP